MTDVRSLRDEVEASPAFEGLGGHVLVHVFCHEKGGAAPVELGYYSPADDTITVFRTQPVMALLPEKIFKGEKELEELQIDAVRIGLAHAKELADAQRRRTHLHHPVAQGIYLLQQLDGPVWNVTLVTATLHMLNYKFDAVTGELRSSQYSSLLDFGEKAR